MAKALHRDLGLKNGSRVLDVGCGKGFLLYEMKHCCWIWRSSDSMFRSTGSPKPETIQSYLFRYRAQDRIHSATSASIW